MKAPYYFEREVELIDPYFFAAFNPRTQRWQIRVWKNDCAKTRIDIFGLYAHKSYVVLNVCYQDEDFNDIGYKPLDQRTLHTLRLARRNADNPVAIAQEVDEANAKLEQEFDENVEYMMRDAAKTAWRHCREPMVDLGSHGAR